MSPGGLAFLAVLPASAIAGDAPRQRGCARRVFRSCYLRHLEAGYGPCPSALPTTCQVAQTFKATVRCDARSDSSPRRSPRFFHPRGSDCPRGRCCLRSLRGHHHACTYFPKTLYRIDECPDLMADGCVGDERQPGLHLSLGARHRRPGISGPPHPGPGRTGLDQFHVIITEQGASIPVFVGNVENLEKRSARLSPHAVRLADQHLAVRSALRQARQGQRQRAGAPAARFHAPARPAVDAGAGHLPLPLLDPGAMACWSCCRRSRC